MNKKEYIEFVKNNFKGSTIELLINQINFVNIKIILNQINIIIKLIMKNVELIKEDC